MAVKARKLVAVEPLVDINQADEDQLSSLLPGVGPVLAHRIVTFRDEHGPFQDLRELANVPGISEKRFSLLSPRISVAPTDSLVRLAAPSSDPGGPTSVRDPLPSSRSSADLHDGIDAEIHFGMSAAALREPGAPSLSSLLPEFDDPDEERKIGGSLMPPPAASKRPPTERALAERAEADATASERAVVESADSPDVESIPLQRSWRVWMAVAALGAFSAIFGTVLGIRSQDGGPRGALEMRVGNVQGQVANLGTSVKALEAQSAGMANSLNALDRRLAAQEQKDVHARPVAAPSAASANTADRAPEPAAGDKDSPAAKPAKARGEGAAPTRPDPKTKEVMRDLRQALHDLDVVAGRKPE